MQDKLELSLLLDYYGAFLTEARREILSLSVDEDLSLGEIAEMKGISRQGVRDALQRGEAQLYDMENKLGLVKRDLEITQLVSKLRHEIERAGVADIQISRILDRLTEITEG